MPGSLRSAVFTPQIFYFKSTLSRSDVALPEEDDWSYIPAEWFWSPVIWSNLECPRHHTSDKDVGGVGLVSRLGGDTQRVEAFVLLVQVGQRQRGSVSAPVHVVPLGGRQQNI